MVGGSIPKESSLLVATEQTFRESFASDCRTRCEVAGISAKEKTVRLKNHATGEVTAEKYDKLVLSPGAAPIRPPLPGIDLPGIFSVRTVPDARSIREWLDRGAADCSGMNSYTGFQTVNKPKRAIVVGGGFIGLEMVENFIERGLEVTLIEKLNQVMPPLDPEMARLLERYLVKHGVKLELSDGVAGFKQTAEGALEVLTESGKKHVADIVILAIGVKPETELAKMAGIELGKRGGIRVDDHMRTTNPGILAVGDAIEVKDFVTGQWTLVPLAGPANRQGRIAADVGLGKTIEAALIASELLAQEVEAATAATAGNTQGADVPREKALLTKMEIAAEQARGLPDARVRYLLDWIRKKMCPGVTVPGQASPQSGAKWNDLRLLIFTEYDDTKRSSSRCSAPPSPTPTWPSTASRSITAPRRRTNARPSSAPSTSIRKSTRCVSL